MLFFQIVTLVLATASTLEAAPHDISTSPTGTDPNVGSHTEDLAENSGGNLERRGFPLLAGIGVVRAVGFIVATVGTALFVNQALTPKEPEKQRFTAPPQVITPTPTSTTTSSIQTQSCNVCIACADIQTPETSAPRPEGGEWFPGYDRSHGHLPKGDKARRIEKITRASRRRRPKRFAKERTARTTICGFYVWSPKYTPWSEHTTKAWNYYDYDMSKVCPKFQFKLDPVQDQTHTYASKLYLSLKTQTFDIVIAEHVYEIQLVSCPTSLCLICRLGSLTRHYR